MKMLTILLSNLLFLYACGNNTAAKTPPPEYVSRHIKTDYKYTMWKSDKEAVLGRINRRANYNASNACHNDGYGWTFKEVVNPGVLDCETHPKNQRIRCRKKNVELECQRLKPGTVGMGMIPFTQ